MGELHLEITTYRIVNDHKVEIKSSPPIVVYRENVKEHERPVRGQVPEQAQPLLRRGVPAGAGHRRRHQERRHQVEGKIKDAKELAKQLQDLGMDSDEARGVVMFKNNNVFLDVTKGIQYLNETIELCKQAFEEAMNLGPLAQEKVMGMKIKLVDAKLHEDCYPQGPRAGHPSHSVRRSMAPCA